MCEQKVSQGRIRRKRTSKQPSKGANRRGQTRQRTTNRAAQRTRTVMDRAVATVVWHNPFPRPPKQAKDMNACGPISATCRNFTPKQSHGPSRAAFEWTDGFWFIGWPFVDSLFRTIDRSLAVCGDHPRFALFCCCACSPLFVWSIDAIVCFGHGHVQLDCVSSPHSLRSCVIVNRPFVHFCRHFLCFVALYCTSHKFCVLPAKPIGNQTMKKCGHTRQCQWQENNHREREREREKKTAVQQATDKTCGVDSDG